MAADPLRPRRVLQIAARSAEHIANALEASAVLLHACMLATDFRFLGFGEDHNARNSVVIARLTARTI
jgi:PI31 proteasome regulator N-terminal